MIYTKQVMIYTKQVSQEGVIAKIELESNVELEEDSQGDHKQE